MAQEHIIEYMTERGSETTITATLVETDEDVISLEFATEGRPPTVALAREDTLVHTLTDNIQGIPIETAREYAVSIISWQRETRRQPQSEPKEVPMSDSNSLVIVHNDDQGNLVVTITAEVVEGRDDMVNIIFDPANGTASTGGVSVPDIQDMMRYYARTLEYTDAAGTLVVPLTSTDSDSYSVQISNWFNNLGAEAESETEVEPETLTFHSTDPMGETIGKVFLTKTDDGFVEIHTINREGIDHQMKLYFDSIERQLPGCLKWIGMPEAELEAAMTDALEWAVVATGGKMAEYSLKENERVVHVVLYQDGAQTMFPIFVEEGEPRYDPWSVSEASDVSYHVTREDELEEGGWRRATIARGSDATTVIRWKAYDPDESVAE